MAYKENIIHEEIIRYLKGEAEYLTDMDSRDWGMQEGKIISGTVTIANKIINPS